MMARAYADCLQPGTHSVARVARHYSVPRKTLENYVTGRTSIQTLYRKLEGGGITVFGPTYEPTPETIIL
jgi:hypothetical protein